jgi:hypothetical protein
VLGGLNLWNFLEREATGGTGIRVWAGTVFIRC